MLKNGVGYLYCSLLLIDPRWDIFVQRGLPRSAPSRLSAQNPRRVEHLAVADIVAKAR